MSFPVIIDMFSTPLYTTMAVDNTLNVIQKEISDVVNKLYSNNLFKQKTNWDSTTHFLSNDCDFSRSILNEENMSYTKSFIMEHVNSFMEHMKCPPCFYAQLESSWLTLTDKGKHAHVHDHSGADISGVYYFKTNEKDGDIFFFNPSKVVKNSRLLINRDPERSFSPQVGRLALWPSYLDHGVKENTTDENRISLSFNISLNKYNTTIGGIAQLGEQ